MVITHSAMCIGSVSNVIRIPGVCIQLLSLCIQSTIMYRHLLTFLRPLLYYCISAAILLSLILLLIVVSFKPCVARNFWMSAVMP